MLFGLYAIGLAAAFLGWTVLGWIRSSVGRAVARSVFVALTATPTILAGHGVAVVPAWFLLFEESLHPFAWIPIGTTTVLGLILVLTIRPLREARTAWPLDVGAVLVRPAYPKALLLGVLAFLSFAAAYQPISDHWQLQILCLLLGAGANFAFCHHAARRFQRTGAFLPLFFAGPIGVTSILVYSIAWYIAGFAGQLVASGKAQRALWLGAVTFGVLCVLVTEHTLQAFRARDLSHVTIQGGVAGNASMAMVALLLTGLCVYGARRARKS